MKSASVALLGLSFFDQETPFLSVVIKSSGSQTFSSAQNNILMENLLLKRPLFGRSKMKLSFIAALISVDLMLYCTWYLVLLAQNRFDKSSEAWRVSKWIPFSLQLSRSHCPESGLFVKHSS